LLEALCSRKVDTHAIEEAFAIFGCALSQNIHTEFWRFSTAQPYLYLQFRKKIECKFEPKINFVRFSLPLAPLGIMDEIMPQIKHSCCIFVVRRLNLLCIQ